MFISAWSKNLRYQVPVYTGNARVTICRIKFVSFTNNERRNRVFKIPSSTGEINSVFSEIASLERNDITLVDRAF